MAPLRVLVVEDSVTMRSHLVQTLRRDPECQVVGEAGDGDSAVRLCETLRPDVVTLDMVLSGSKTGVEVTEHIMAYCPTPILVVSSSFNRRDVAQTFQALAAGAVEVIEKPSGREPEGVWERTFLQSVKLAARIKVIRHPRQRLRELERPASPPPRPAAAATRPGAASGVTPAVAVERHRGPARSLIAIGASTGGPAAVVEVLRHALPAPVLLIIHIGTAFSMGLIDWLAQVLPQRVCEVVDGQPLPSPGTHAVFVAPADRHLIVQGGHLRLSHQPERNACRPSIDVLFESVAEHLGPRAVGCLLTGMGRDGAEGLLRMRQAGAATVAQDQSTSVVFGMPREAIRLGAAERVLRLHEIGPALVALVSPAG
jgi:two-component system chemotaxis response regulator CheB